MRRSIGGMRTDKGGAHDGGGDVKKEKKENDCFAWGFSRILSNKRTE